MKVIIPVAGLGTRMLPATKAIPKEMLTLVDKPLIQYVVNECVDDGMGDDSVNWNCRTTFNGGDNFWYATMGTDYVEKAFRMAHEADPNAELILNDYGAEFKGNAKAEAFYNLAKYLKEKGAPITGVGLQCHLDAGNVDIQKLKATFDRFNAIGLKCVITELDLGMDNSETARAQQAKDYYNIAKTAMEAENCDELMIWGLTDGMTWRNGRYPLLFDADLNMKDAYYGTHIAMRCVAPTTGIEDVTTAILIITCIATNAVIPVATKLPNISGAFIAINIPLQIKIANNIITKVQPIKPNSSANTEKIKSFCGSGKYKYFCLL